MRLVVLAAGFATRMHPLTLERAKPLLEVGGRPVLSRILDRVLALDGLSEGVVVTNGKFHHQFEAWLGGYASPVPLRLWNDRTESDADKLGATADLALGLESLGGPPEDVLVVAGDNLFEFDLAPCAAAFRAGGGHLLLVRTVEGPIPPARYNEVTLGPAGEVLSFREKPADPVSPLSALCLYFFRPTVAERLREYLAAGGNPDAPGYFLEWLSRRERLDAVRIQGPWYDIGNLATLAAAREAYAGAQ